MRCFISSQNGRLTQFYYVTFLAWKSSCVNIYGKYHVCKPLKLGKIQAARFQLLMMHQLNIALPQ